jgi:hypothetical protein
LAHNDIKVVEQGLFDYNPDLVLISLSNNMIQQIHPDVFNHLTKLSYLNLKSNYCIDRNADNTLKEIKEIMQVMGNLCPYTSTTTTEKEVLTTTTSAWLESTEEPTIDQFQLKIQNIESKLEKSNLESSEKYRNLTEKIEKVENALKNTDENIQNLKTEMIGAMQKILEKFEESSMRCERKTAEKIDAISLDLKATQNEAFTALNDRMNNLEAGLSILQSKMSEQKKAADATCDSE